MTHFTRKPALSHGRYFQLPLGRVSGPTNRDANGEIRTCLPKYQPHVASSRLRQAVYLPSVTQVADWQCERVESGDAKLRRSPNVCKF